MYVPSDPTPLLSIPFFPPSISVLVSLSLLSHLFFHQLKPVLYIVVGYLKVGIRKSDVQSGGAKHIMYLLFAALKDVISNQQKKKEIVIRNVVKNIIKNEKKTNVTKNICHEKIWTNENIRNGKIPFFLLLSVFLFHENESVLTCIRSEIIFTHVSINHTQ